MSVIICAKNEEKNLEKNLPFILQQNYTSFEVIVVDDASSDYTPFLLFNLQEKFKNLKVVTLSPKDSCGKKNALTQGIKASQYDYLLMTDADCRPKSQHWITGIANHFSHKNEIILGYGGYEERPGLLNQLIRFDTIFIAIQYLSFSLWGKPYMGVGRNLAYRKDLFERNNGFENHKNVMSGDDDLFINEVASSGNTCIETNSYTHTLSSPKTSWESWFHQKKRHLTTGIKYRRSIQFWLSLFQGSSVAFYASFTYLIVEKSLFWPVLFLFFIRTFTQIFIFKACVTKLEEKHNVALFPVFELLILFLNLILVLSNLIYTPNTWQKT